MGLWVFRVLGSSGFPFTHPAYYSDTYSDGPALYACMLHALSRGCHIRIFELMAGTLPLTRIAPSPPFPPPPPIFVTDPVFMHVNMICMLVIGWVSKREIRRPRLWIKEARLSVTLFPQRVHAYNNNNKKKKKKNRRPLTIKRKKQRKTRK